MNKINYICGLPGFGSSGDKGEIGDRGLSFHIIDSSAIISDDDLKSHLVNNAIYNENDIFIFNKDLYLINKKSNDGNILISYNKLCDNPLKQLIDVTDSYNNIGYNMILTDTIKIKKQLNDINTNSSLSIKSINNKFIDYINKNDETKSFIKLSQNENEYIIGDNNILTINNLYTKDNNNILTEKYGISELHALVMSRKIIDNTCKFNYKISSNSKYRVTGLSIDNNNNNTLNEEILIDFNDNKNSFIINNEHDIYKVYYLSNIETKNDSTFSGDLITECFKLNTTTSKLKKCEVNGDGKVSIDKNTISILQVTDKIADISLYFTDDSDTTIYNTTEGIDVQSNNNIVRIKILEQEFNKLYTIDIGHVKYNIILNKLITNIIPQNISFSINEDKNGYLSCNKNFDHGVPTNGILQVYSLDFDSLDDTSNYEFKFNISSDIESKLTDTVFGDCSIYYKMIKKNKSNDKIHNDTYIYLSDLEDASVSSIYFPKGKNVIKYNNTIGRIHLDKYKLNDNMSSYKLAIYYEFNEPFYGILNTSIDVTVIANETTIKDSITKKTLMIPWEIIGFVPQSLKSATDYNLSIKNVIKRDGIIYPQNLLNLTLTPTVNNKFMQNNTFKKYNYRGTNLSTINEKFEIDKQMNMYISDAFLSVAYNLDDKGDISYYIKYDGQSKTSNKINFAQCKYKFPTWVKSLFNINIDKHKYQYDSSIIYPSGTIYSPQSAEDFMVDLHPTNKRQYSNYKNHFINNTFVGYVEWAIHKNIIEKNDNGTSSEYIIKFPFTDINTLQNDTYNTLYSLYWLLSPRVILASNDEYGYDCAINMLKRPKIYTPNGNKKYYLNSAVDVKNVFNMRTYSKPTTIKLDSVQLKNDNISNATNDFIIYNPSTDKLL